MSDVWGPLHFLAEIVIEQETSKSQGGITTSKHGVVETKLTPYVPKSAFI